MKKMGLSGPELLPAVAKWFPNDKNRFFNILNNFMGFKRPSVNSQTYVRWKSGESLVRHGEADLLESVA